MKHVRSKHALREALGLSSYYEATARKKRHNCSVLIRTTVPLPSEDIIAGATCLQSHHLLLKVYPKQDPVLLEAVSSYPMITQATRSPHISIISSFLIA